MYDCSEMVFMHLPAIFFLIAMLLYALNCYVENSCSFPLWNNCPYFSMRFICAPQTPEDMRVLFIRKLMIRFFFIVLYAKDNLYFMRLIYLIKREQYRYLKLDIFMNHTIEN